MTEREKIEKAVEDLKGLASNADLDIRGFDFLWKSDSGKYNWTQKASSAYNRGDTFCTRTEFEQVAKELGWCNGYKWGVDYQINGEEPDLPDYLVVAVFCYSTNRWAICGSREVGYWCWEDVKIFRITDHRYKPKEPDGDWFNRGELPPVGATVECKNTGAPVVIVGHDEALCRAIYRDKDYSELEYDSGLAESFRPLRTEEDELLEKIENSLRNANTQVLDKYTYKTLAKQLLKDGLAMKEDECTAHML